MSNIYSGAADSRQSDDVNMKTSRFRPKYRALTEEEKDLHDGIKDTATFLEELILMTPKSREQSLAITKLEESIMWAIKSLTA